MGSALGFEALAGFKMPSLQGMQKAAANKAQFGDKKLAVVTGTSSGVPFVVLPTLRSLVVVHTPWRSSLSLNPRSAFRPQSEAVASSGRSARTNCADFKCLQDLDVLQREHFYEPASTM